MSLVGLPRIIVQPVGSYSTESSSVDEQLEAREDRVLQAAPVLEMPSGPQLVMKLR